MFGSDDDGEGTQYIKSMLQHPLRNYKEVKEDSHVRRKGIGSRGRAKSHDPWVTWVRRPLSK